MTKSIIHISSLFQSISTLPTPSNGGVLLTLQECIEILAIPFLVIRDCQENIFMNISDNCSRVYDSKNAKSTIFPSLGQYEHHWSSRELWLWEDFFSTCYDRRAEPAMGGHFVNGDSTNAQRFSVGIMSDIL